MFATRSIFNLSALCIFLHKNGVAQKNQCRKRFSSPISQFRLLQLQCNLSISRNTNEYVSPRVAMIDDFNKIYWSQGGPLTSHWMHFLYQETVVSFAHIWDSENRGNKRSFLLIILCNLIIICREKALVINNIVSVANFFGQPGGKMA